MDAKNAVGELLDHIADVTNDLDTNDRIMVLCTVGEHCKAYVETMLAHAYHAALYERKKVSE